MTKLEMIMNDYYDASRERLDKIKMLAENGLTINEITKELDITYGGVRAAIKRHGIPVKLQKKYNNKV